MDPYWDFGLDKETTKGDDVYLNTRGILCTLTLVTILLVPFVSFSQNCERIEWTPPTTLVDGTAIPPGTQLRYNVYQGQSASQLSLTATVLKPFVLCSDITITPGHFVAVTAVANGLLESNKSTALQLLKLSPPSGLLFILQVRIGQ